MRTTNVLLAAALVAAASFTAGCDHTHSSETERLAEDLGVCETEKDELGEFKTGYDDLMEDRGLASMGFNTEDGVDELLEDFDERDRMELGYEGFAAAMDTTFDVNNVSGTTTMVLDRISALNEIRVRADLPESMQPNRVASTVENHYDQVDDLAVDLGVSLNGGSTTDYTVVLTDIQHAVDELQARPGILDQVKVELGNTSLTDLAVPGAVSAVVSERDRLRAEAAEDDARIADLESQLSELRSPFAGMTDDEILSTIMDGQEAEEALAEIAEIVELPEGTPNDDVVDEVEMVVADAESCEEDILDANAENDALRGTIDSTKYALGAEMVGNGDSAEPNITDEELPSVAASTFAMAQGAGECESELTSCEAARDEFEVYLDDSRKALNQPTLPYENISGEVAMLVSAEEECQTALSDCQMGSGSGDAVCDLYEQELDESVATLINPTLSYEDIDRFGVSESVADLADKYIRRGGHCINMREFITDGEDSAWQIAKYGDAGEVLGAQNICNLSDNVTLGRVHDDSGIPREWGTEGPCDQLEVAAQQLDLYWMIEREFDVLRADGMGEAEAAEAACSW